MTLRLLLRTLAVPALLFSLSAHAQRTVAEQFLLLSINEERASAGLAALAWDEHLAMAAHRHAQEMAAANTMSHQLRGEPELASRVAAAGAHFPVLAENVGVGPAPAAMHRALMDSQHHRENILDPKMNAVGVAVVFARGELWVAEDFAVSLPRIPLEEQERRVVSLLAATGLPQVGVTAEARAMCDSTTGYVGSKPAFVVRYTASALTRLPEELLARLALGGASQAAVGACSPAGASLYTFAVVLYR